MDGFFLKTYGNFLLMTKLTMLFLLMVFVVLPVMASGQHTGIRLKDVDLQVAFKEIKQKMGYTFVCNDQMVKNAGKISVDIVSDDVNLILKKCLESTDLDFYIEDKVIVIVSKPEKRSAGDEKKNVTAKGKIVDTQQQPLPGASVVIKGTSLGTVSDHMGEFTLTLPGNEKIILVISFVGMETQEIEFSGNDPIRVVMQEQTNEIGEVTVVSTGYQTVNRKDMVGSYRTLKVDDIRIPAYSNIVDMLQGQVASMIVTRQSARAGSSPKIKIRGTTTLSNTDPIFVVDGIIQDDPIRFNASIGMIDDIENIIGNQVAWLNPNDIETVTILKDASATAIYGSRASNGVIVITTKKPKMGDRISVNYSGSVTISPRPVYRQFNLMNSQERVAFSEEAYEAGAKYASEPIRDINTFEGSMAMFFDGQISEEEYVKRRNEMETMNTDWLELLTETSVSHNHNLSIGGSSARANYTVSLGYNKEKGQEKGNSSERFTSRAAVNFRLHDRVNVAVTLNGALNKNTGYANGVDPLAYATATSRAIPAYEKDGSFAFYKRNNTYKYNKQNLYLDYNILNEMENSASTVKNAYLGISVDFSWRMTDWLKYQFTGGYSYTGVNTERYSTERSFYIANKYRGYDYGTLEPTHPWYKAAQLPHGGELFSSEATQYNYNIQNKLLLEHEFNPNHRINVMLGTEVRSSMDHNMQNMYYGYVPDRGHTFVRPNIPQEIIPIMAGEVPEGFDILNELYTGGNSIAKRTDNFFSLFATAAYSAMGRYVFNFNIRHDASNRFGQRTNRRFDPTYSLGGAWRISSEPWMQWCSSVLSDLNLKVTYGIQGNANLATSPELILKMGGVKDFYETYFSTIVSIPNPNLAWERTHTWNYGLDLQLFERFNVVLDYYTRKSNAVIKQNIPYLNGQETMNINGGILYNKGFEVTVSFNPVNKKDFGINVSLNSSKNWNRGGKTPFEPTYEDFLKGISTSILKKGYPVNGFWSYSFAGLNPENGSPMFNHMEVEEAVAKADPTRVLVYSGSSEPDFTGGLNFGIRYKSLTLNSSFSLLLGGHKRLPNPYRDFGAGVRLPDATKNITKELNKRWKKAGDHKVTDIPALMTGEYRTVSPFNSNANLISELYQNSDALVVSSSFLRCQNLGLTWRMKNEQARKMGLNSLSVSASVNNLFVIASKRYHGFDPELEESIMPKRYTVSLNVGF